MKINFKQAHKNIKILERLINELTNEKDLALGEEFLYVQKTMLELVEGGAFDTSEMFLEEASNIFLEDPKEMLEKFLRGRNAKR